MLNYNELQNQLNLLKNAITRFEEAIIADDNSDIYRDAILQRFEFTIELTRKTLKKIVQYNKWNSNLFPKGFIEEFQSINVIDNASLWIDFIDERNKLSHIYSLDKSQETYKFIKENYKEFRNLYNKLKEYVAQN